MTEHLLQKLEEKLVNLLAELEDLHLDIRELKEENQILKNEKIQSTQKIQSLITLLDSFDLPEMALDNHELQGSEEDFAEAVTA